MTLPTAAAPARTALHAGLLAGALDIAAAGLGFGIAVWAVMTFAVVPLSAATPPPPDMAAALKGLTIHILFVDPAIAWVTRRMLG